PRPGGRRHAGRRTRPAGLTSTTTATRTATRPRKHRDQNRDQHRDRERRGTPGGCMYPSRFRYEAPRSIGEALDLLHGGDGEAKVLAGGQSLLPMMKLRFA